ncbi:hypothetical protein KTQ42_21745 [Noviherbaspirillum sp. L7-7A]|uniref:hypothetical protein n=1 Tax=Noviherbaspirillum sp. L7-7A TaxID=2850560 RepID=UPI001C2CA476|nr:hypothetical protein [Noviherbaspirillum sp. L7-7A]MBV0881904.1 hypothetical protein [Noviherbaspirillum sp. L7-7A]
MLSKEYFKRCEQERAEAKAALRAREKAFSAAVAANPDMYRSLKRVAGQARMAFNDVESEHRKLSRLQTAGRELKVALQDFRADARDFIEVGGLLTLVGIHLQPVDKQRNAVIETYDSAEATLNEHFPDLNQLS